LESANRAAALDPSNEWSHRIRALCLVEMKQRKPALESAREAARLAPHALEPLNVLALCLCVNRKVAEAGEIATAMISTAPDASLAHFTAGMVSQRSGRLAEAEAHYRRALALNAESWDAMNNLGLVLDGQGKRKEAIDMFHNAARLKPMEKISQENLKRTVGTYLSGGIGISYILFQVVRAMFHSAGVDLTRYVASIAVPLAAAIIVYDIWLRRKRKAELHDSVKLFYEAEIRRERRESVWLFGPATILAATVLPIAIWTAMAATDGIGTAGLDTPAVVGYAVLWLALVLEIVWIWRLQTRHRNR